MHWGHKISGKGTEVEVTRAEYNASFGVDVPYCPDIPDAVSHVWGWWWKLNARRRPGYDSMSPISYFQIYSWSVLTRTQVSPAEVDILTMMDDAYLRAVADERKEQRDRDK
jgi:hypothetical protein